MIFKWLLDLLTLILQPLFSVLPSFTVPVLSSGSPEITHGASNSVWLNHLLPVQEFWVVAQFMMDWVYPLVIAYEIGNWLYRHLPIWGGMGSG